MIENQSNETPSNLVLGCFFIVVYNKQMDFRLNKKYLIFLIAIIFIANIGIFYILSKQLEIYVINRIIDANTVKNSIENYDK